MTGFKDKLWGYVKGMIDGEFLGVRLLEDDTAVIRLYLGDCRDFIKTIDCKTIDAIISDPPYGIAYHKGESGGGVGGRKRILN